MTPPAREVVSERAPHARACAMLLALFAFTLLADRAKRHGFTPENLVVVVPALLVVAWPTDKIAKAALLVMATAHVAAFFVTGSIQIIWYVCALFFTALLLVVVGRIVHDLRARKGPRFSLAHLFDDVAPFARAIAVIGMFAAGFAKLNHDFLNPSVSCGAIYTSWLITSPLFFFVPAHPVVEVVGLYAALVIELAAPLLLLWSRTRALGLALFALLCMGLALNPRSHYFDFAGLYLVLALFFVPAHLLARVHTVVRAGARSISFLRAPSTRARVLRAIAFVVATCIAFLPSLGLRPGVALEGMRFVLLATWSVMLAIVFWRAVVERARARPAPISNGVYAVHLAWIVPLAMLANEASPYLGLIHRPTMTMAANLHMHPSSSNHVLVRRPLVLEVSREVVVVASTHAHLKKGQRMPYARFVDRMHRDAIGEVTFTIDGGSEQRARGDDARFEGGAWLARLLRLGTHGPPRTGPKGCGKSRPRGVKNPT